MAFICDILLFLTLTTLVTVSKQQVVPWYLEPAIVTIGGEAKNAAYDPNSGTLVVFSDVNRAIYVFNTSRDASFHSTSPISWELASKYPSGSYGLLMQGNNLIYCESDLGTTCVRIDVNSNTQTPSRVVHQGGRFAPAILPRQNYFLAFSTANVFSYIDSSSMEHQTDRSQAFDSPARSDSYLAGPTYVYDSDSYIMWLRPTSASEDREQNTLIKVGRFCGNVQRFNYYVEKPFSSSHIGSQNVTVTPFTESFALSTRRNLASISLCFLTRQMIRDEVNATIEQCKAGVSADQPGFANADYNVDFKCRSPSVRSNAGKGCESVALFSAMQSTDCLAPVTIDLPSAVSSFVDSASLELSDSKSLLFFTDSQGRYVKISVTKSGNSFQTSFVRIQNLSVSLGPGEQVIRMFVQRSYAQLVFVTSQRVIRIPASDCSQYQDCNTCVSSGDPLCAWCPTSGSCAPTLGNSCAVTAIAGVAATVCPRLSADDVDVTLNQQLKLSVTPWPFDNASPLSYYCEFGPAEMTMGNISGNSIFCKAPSLAGRSMAVISVKLTAKFVGSGDQRINVAVANNVSIFNCSALQNCSSCAGAINGKCYWCFDSGKCSSGSACPGNRVDHRLSCPVLSGFFHGNNVLPSLSYPFDVSQVANPMRFRIKSGSDIISTATELKCGFLARNGSSWGSQYPAHINDGHIDCQTAGFPIPTDLKLLPAASREFVLNAVVYANGKALDYDVQEMTVRFFSCSPSPAANSSLNRCGHCRSLPKIWNCAWCDSRCVSASVCSDVDNMATEACQTVIKSFSPVSGPEDGGTLVKISTEDLDTELHNLRVTVASIDCVVDSLLSHLPDTVACRTGRGIPDRRGLIALHDARLNKPITEFKDTNFTYLPMIADSRVEIIPEFGPMAGGTLINVNGINIGIGSERSIWFGDERCLNLIVKSRNSLQCTSPPSSDHRSMPIHVIVDQFNSSITLAGRWREPPQFVFKPNPRPIVVPSVSNAARIKIARRGGSPIYVNGTNLSSSPAPLFFVNFNDSLVITSPCVVNKTATNEQIICRSPVLPAFLSFKDYGLQFSENAIFRSAEQQSWPKLEISDNPEFTKATIDITTGVLTLSGFNLDDAFTIADYNITIGDRSCTMQSLSSQVIICMVSLTPPTDPKSGNVSFVPIENLAHSPVNILLGGLEPAVIIKSVSSVEGGSDVLKQLMENPLPVFIPVAVGVVVLLIVIILVACMCTKAKREHLRKYDQTKGLANQQQQQQLTKFQRRIFADQTQVAPQEVRWNAEIPFHKYRDYCQNFFFPMVDDFRSLQTPPDVANIGVVELERFYRLLLRENFLIAFVNALENPHHFKHTDITRVAALLSVVLQPHMVYHTAIIKRLLDDLIFKTGQRNPSELKQLLRRAEHVVERLLANWLAMLLYEHVLSGPGQALFRLSRACHLKTTSGKVDPATGRSLYALSERSLLQDPSEPLEITLNIFDNVRSAIQTEEGRRTVTVLDCDTVAQAKAKILDAIYEGVPFSARLTPADCDIQFVQADGKRVDLPDDNHQQPKTGPNGTLPNGSGKTQKPVLIKSFNIENNTKVIIIRRPAGTYGTNTTSLKSVVSQQSSNGAAGSSGTGDSHSLLNGSPLLPGSHRPLVNNTSANSSAMFFDHVGDEQKTPGGTRRSGGLLGGNNTGNRNNRGRAGSERGEKRSSRTSNASSAAAAAVVESIAPPSEYFLSLLLITKKSLQEHIDNLFASLFRLQSPTDSSFPMAIRYLFDIFDELGRKHGITDPEVLYCWKTNAVPLRFWVNLIQNPDYLLDIEVIEPVKHCLSVVTQALMDSCARDPQPLSQRSASNKQLFSEDVVRYRGYVQKYYSDIQLVDFGGPLEFTMNNFLSEQSHIHARSFDPQGALRRLAESALRYSADIDRQLRTSQGFNSPVVDGPQLADEFAAIVRDLRIAGIGSTLPNSSGSAPLFTTNATTPNGNGNVSISFTATPVGVPGQSMAPPSSQLSRSNRAGSQIHHQQPQIVAASSQMYQQQQQFIVMKHPTHL